MPKLRDCVRCKFIINPDLPRLDYKEMGNIQKLFDNCFIWIDTGPDVYTVEMSLKDLKKLNMMQLAMVSNGKIFDIRKASDSYWLYDQFYTLLKNIVCTGILGFKRLFGLFVFTLVSLMCMTAVFLLVIMFVFPRFRKIVVICPGLLDFPFLSNNFRQELTVVYDGILDHERIPIEDLVKDQALYAKYRSALFCNICGLARYKPKDKFSGKTMYCGKCETRKRDACTQDRIHRMHTCLDCEYNLYDQLEEYHRDAAERVSKIQSMDRRLRNKK